MAGKTTPLQGDIWTFNSDPTGGVFLVSTPDASIFGFDGDISFNPSAARHLVAWRDGRNEDIYGQLIGVDGTRIGNEIQVTDVVGDQAHPAIAANTTSGEFLVVWLDCRESQVVCCGGADEPAVFAKIITSDGMLGSADIPIAMTATFQLEVAFNSTDNEYLVVWDDQRATNAIFAQRVASNGMLLGGQLNVSGFSHSAHDPNVVYLPSLERFLVVWWVFIGGDVQIQGRMLTKDGTGGERFNIAAASSSVIASGIGMSDRALVAWADCGNSTSGVSCDNADIYGQFVGQDDSTCQPGEEILCLNRRRFKVEGQWRDYLDRTGRGKVVPLSSDQAGLFWFFESSNWEVMVKVLNGCELNDRYWVFSAATTDVEYTLRVTDTETGAVAEYFNPLGAAAPAITDTGAFATCP